MSRVILDIDDLSMEEIEYITSPKDFPLADASKFNVLIEFYQESTRTFHSFYYALKKLNNIPNISSTVPKGSFRSMEMISYADELQTMLFFGVDLVIARTDFEVKKEDIPNGLSFISAGNYTLSHPSQSLVDLASLRKASYMPKNIIILGDYASHRTGKSFSALIKKFYPTVSIKKINNIDETDKQQLEQLKNADLIYQMPYKSWSNEKATGVQLNLETVKKYLNPTCKIMHAFPRHEELSRDLDNTPYNLYTEQLKSHVTTKARLISVALEI